MKQKQLFTNIMSFLLIMSTVLAISACSFGGQERKEKTVFGYFDTVSTFSAYGRIGESEFRSLADDAEDLLAFYHRESDIYHEYEGTNNLCTLNKNAGGEAIPVSDELFDLLCFCRSAYDLTDGRVNVMMGAVLSLWHDLREEGTRLPTAEELEERSAHISMDSLVLNDRDKTARITDPNASIDVGAIAKGYACRKIRDHLIEMGADSFVIDLGGNLSVIGKKPDGKSFTAGIKNPDADAAKDMPYAYTLTVENTSLSTSGGYERYYSVDGVKYHHCIDPDTLFPATFYDSVTVLCNDSALSDTLSTALFLLPREEGKILLEKAKSLYALSFTVIYIKDGEVEKTEV